MRRAVLSRSLIFTLGLLGCGGDSSAEDPSSSDSDGLQVSPTSGATTATSTDGVSLLLDVGNTTLNSGDGDPSSTGLDCASVEVQFTAVVPTVTLLIDQSSTMGWNFSGGVTRWDAVRGALIDPVDGVIAALEDEVRFGLALYTASLDSNGVGSECPLLVEVEPAFGNYDTLEAVYAAEEPIDDTPTGESIDAVAAALLADEDEGPKFIVLATDGDPETCSNPEPHDEARTVAVEAAQNAFASGIQTFIISVGNDVTAEHLQDMANAGSGWSPGDPDAEYYVPEDQDEMVAVFEEIISQTRSCVFTLDQAIKSGHSDNGTVTINGEEIPYNDPNGWQINSPTEIELVGDACEAVQDGDVEIEAVFTCHGIQPG